MDTDEPNQPTDAAVAARLWTEALGLLRQQTTTATFETWLANTTGLNHKDGAFTIQVENPFARDWLENRMRSHIERTLANLLGECVTVAFQTQDQPTPREATPDDDLEQTTFLIDGIHVQEYTAIVQPDRVFVGSQYYRRQWLPLLGPVAWCLILELRQRCYWNKTTGEKRDQCTATFADLGRAIGTSPSTARRTLMPHDKDRAALIAEFILRRLTLRAHNPRLGRQVNKTSLWTVRLDDPLVPEDLEK